MKKFLALLVSVCLVGGVLTGCGFSVGKEVPLSEVLNKDEGSEVEDSAEQEEVIEDVTSTKDVESMSAEDIVNEAFGKTTSASGKFVLDVSIDMQLDTSTLTEEEASQLIGSLVDSGVSLDSNNSTNFMYMNGTLYFSVGNNVSYAGGDIAVGMMGMFDESVNSEAYVDLVEGVQYSHQDNNDWVMSPADTADTNTSMFTNISDSFQSLSEPEFDGKLIKINAKISGDVLEGVSGTDLVDVGAEPVSVVITIDYDLNPVSVEFDMASMFDADTILGGDFAGSGMDMFKFRTTAASFVMTYDQIGNVIVEIPQEVLDSAVEEVHFDDDDVIINYEGLDEGYTYTGMSDTIADLMGWSDLSESDLWNKEFAYLFTDYALLKTAYDSEGQEAFQNVLSLIYNATEDDLFYLAENFSELDNPQRYAVYLISFKDLPTFKVSSLTNIVYDVNSPQKLRDAYNEMSEWKKEHGLQW